MSDVIQADTLERLQKLVQQTGALSNEQLVLMALQSLDSNLCTTEPDDEAWAAIDRAESQPDIPAEEAERRIFSRTRRKTPTP